MGADMKVTRAGWIAYALALITVLLDQWSKAYVTGPLDLADKGSIAILPFFHLTSVANRGVSFGLLRADTAFGRWLLVGFSAAVVIGLAVWSARQSRIWTAVATGLIMGGAIGNNLIDRARYGAVVDFLDFSGLGFKWVFNVADSAITVGVVLLLLDSLLTSGKPAAPASS